MCPKVIPSQKVVRTNVVLPEIKSYPQIAWDMRMTFQCWRILNSEFWAKDKNFWPQNGPKTCLGASRAHLSTQKSSSLPHFNYFLGWNHFWIELSHQIPTLTNERKSVTIPKPTHFQNGDQMNISQNIKFCNNKKTLSLIHPTQSHSIPPNPTIDVLMLKLIAFIFGTETMMSQKNCQGWMVGVWDGNVGTHPTPIPLQSHQDL